MVRITDHPDMTSVSYYGRKAIHTNYCKILFNIYLSQKFPLHLGMYQDNTDKRAGKVDPDQTAPDIGSYPDPLLVL